MNRWRDTFAHNYDNSRPVLRQSFEDTININDIKDLKGNIVSWQYNKSSTPIGILSGKWSLAQVLANNTNTTKLDIVFTTNMTITGVDGLDSHKYQLWEFKNLKITLTGKTAIINGTVSLILKSRPAVYSASMSIRVLNLETISINIDKNLARHYFGDTPIYGTISN
jgi:hypothetical protein